MGLFGFGKKKKVDTITASAPPSFDSPKSSSIPPSDIALPPLPPDEGSSPGKAGPDTLSSGSLEPLGDLDALPSSGTDDVHPPLEMVDDPDLPPGMSDPLPSSPSTVHLDDFELPDFEDEPVSRPVEKKPEAPVKKAVPPPLPKQEVHESTLFSSTPTKRSDDASKKSDRVALTPVHRKKRVVQKKRVIYVEHGKYKDMLLMLNETLEDFTSAPAQLNNVTSTEGLITTTYQDVHDKLDEIQDVFVELDQKIYGKTI